MTRAPSRSATVEEPQERPQADRSANALGCPMSADAGCWPSHTAQGSKRSADTSSVPEGDQVVERSVLPINAGNVRPRDLCRIVLGDLQSRHGGVVIDHLHQRRVVDATSDHWHCRHHQARTLATAGALTSRKRARGGGAPPRLRFQGRRDRVQRGHRGAPNLILRRRARRAEGFCSHQSRGLVDELSFCASTMNRRSPGVG